MKSQEEVWADDKVDRRADASFLYDFLMGVIGTRRTRGQQGSFVINVDADWGAGKSFFIDHLAEDLQAKDHIVARVNAWRDDHVDEPFVAVLSAIDTALLPFVKKERKSQELWDKLKKGAVPIVGRVALGVAKTLVRKHVGVDTEELVSGFGQPTDGIVADVVASAEDAVAVEIERVADEAMAGLINKFTQGNEAIEDFRSRLAAAVAALGSQAPLPLFVLVDELDRCRPSYAVALLERVKHLFEVENVVFIFATNADQLQHSVQGAYGPNFDGYRYLSRFFERTYQLHAPDPSQFIVSECQRLDLTRCQSPILDPGDFLVEVCKAWHLTLREVKQFVDILETLVAVWPNYLRVDLVSASFLSVSYLRRGKAEWEVAQQLLPDFDIENMAYRHQDYFVDRARPQESFSVMSAFQEIKSVKDSINATIKLGQNDHMSLERRYAHDVFIPEWNGKPVDRLTPTMLARLPAAISNAGRLA